MSNSKEAPPHFGVWGHIETELNESHFYFSLKFNSKDVFPEFPLLHLGFMKSFHSSHYVNEPGIVWLTLALFNSYSSYGTLLAT